MILQIYKNAYNARYKPCEHAAAHLAGLEAVQAWQQASGVPDSVRALSETLASAVAEQKRAGDLYRAERTFEDLTEVYEEFECADNKLQQAKDALADRCLTLLATHPAERCIACDKPLKAGDRVLPDAEGGTIHAACCGPERESYTKGDGEPLNSNDPIPQGYVYEPEYPAGQSAGPGAEPRQMAEGCCSAVSPCSHQRRDPYSLCAVCQKANGLADKIQAAAPVSTRTGDDGAEWVRVPAKATREWAYAMAVARQGQSSTPRCEPTSEREIVWAAERINEALAARPAVPEAQGAWRSKAADDVLAERRRQVTAEGWTPEHDDTHSRGEMAQAAACYALPQAQRHCLDARDNRPILSHLWPWDRAWWKPGDRRRELVKAGALILAEIERLDRATHPAEQSAGAGAGAVAHLKPCPWEEPHLCCYPKCTCAKDREDDREIDRILALSGDELHAELVAEGHDPDALVRQMKQGLDGTLRLAADRQRWREEAASWRRVAEKLQERANELEAGLKPFAAVLAEGEPVGPIPRGHLDSRITRNNLRLATKLLADKPFPDGTRTGDEVTVTAPLVPTEEVCLAGLGVDRTSVFSAPSVMRDMAASYRAMIAARPAVPEAQGAWKPIETAPCGEMVWLFEPHTMGGFMFAGVRSVCGWFNNLDHKNQAPTHWMPLPAPPPSGQEG